MSKMIKLMNAVTIAETAIRGITGVREGGQEGSDKIRRAVSVLSQKVTLGVKEMIGGEIDRSIEDVMNLPNEIKHELRRMSSHEGMGRVFKPQLNQYDYFNAYYQQRQQRYQTPTQPNLAEKLYRRESIVRNSRRL